MQTSRALPITFFALLISLSSFDRAHAETFERLFVPWGHADGQVGITIGPVGTWGPTSFQVENGQIAILDSENRAIKVFQDAKVTKIIPIEQRSDDFVLLSDTHFFALSDNVISEFDEGNRLLDYRGDDAGFLITRLGMHRYGNVIATVNDDFTAFLEFGKENIEITVPGISDQYGGYVQIAKIDWGHIEISSPNVRFVISSDAQDLALARYLGRASDGSYYIYLERVVNHVPLKVVKEVRLYDPEGGFKSVLSFPTHAYSEVFKEFYVDIRGRLYQMVSAKDGIYILEHRFERDKFRHQMPEKFVRPYHFNESGLKSPELSLPAVTATITSDDLPTLTRTESLALADQIIQHDWVATAENISDGTIEDGDGNHVHTPAWVRVGANKKLPYKWGGFDTVDMFDAGLKQHKYAGDNDTDDVSNYAVGIDCSGFVSRSWKLPVHVATIEMDTWEKIKVYKEWKDLKAGDLIHKVGHVRLSVAQNPNGSLQVAEASATDWRTSYRIYTYSSLSAYTPRYYVNMRD